MPAGNGQMTIQFFRDPIGSKWRSPEEKARREAERKIAAQKKAEAKRAADKKAKEKAEAARQPPVIDEVDLPEDQESSQLKEELEQASEETPVEQVPPQPVKRPFYSVPYTYRAPVANVGPGQAKPVDTSVPPARAGGTARRVADNGDSGGPV
ncbi:tetratricopeptide repeat protein, partial [Aduncisulcus paluster]